MPSSKKKSRGVLLPPAVGYSLRIVCHLCKTNKIPLGYFPKLLAIVAINLINMPFRVYERKFINPRFKNLPIEKEPVFILGHWRSGTTHLHNLLSRDPQMGYVITFQSVFPDTLFNKTGRFVFENFTRLLIPRTRKGDNVTLDPSNPQEEEFSLGDKTPMSFYYFWMFPNKIIEYYNSFVRFIGIPKNEMDSWKTDYKLLIKKALKNTGRERFLSKNPSNTARIKVLLEMFPNAKFIHIFRNPVEVFLSTSHFYKIMMPHLKLQNISQEEIDGHILDIYKKLMNDYFEQKGLIPSGNLVEIAFEDLEQNAEAVLKSIYGKLNLPGFESAKPNFEAYLHKMKDYQKNTHKISKDHLERILDEWGFTMKKFGYSVPGNIEVF